MTRKLHKILGVVLTATLLASLMMGLLAMPAVGSKHPVIEDGPGPWARAIDGTFYAYAKMEGQDYLWKSTDDGHTWEVLPDYEGDAIVDIVVSPVDAEIIYVASANTVYRSSDGGDDFNAKSTNVYSAPITSLDVTFFSDAHILVIGTGGTDEEVYYLDEGETFGDWVDIDVGIVGDVLDVAFSPNFEEDRQLVAVVSTGTEVYVTTMLAGGNWNVDVADSEPIPVASATNACIVFPDDYDSDPDTGNYVQFVGVGDGAGNDTDVGVYLILGVEAGIGETVVLDMDTGIDVDIQSLAISGDGDSATILAGMQQSNQVRRSNDGGINWYPAKRPPRGDGNVYLIMADDFATSGEAWAAVQGLKCTVSRTTDGGIKWKRISHPHLSQ